MPATDTKKAGADAASDKQVGDAFRELINNDPEIQAVIQRVWGKGPRPSDTPKNLEQANHQASEQIKQILKTKGIELPGRTFINPRSGALEGHRGWSGLNGWQKAAIIAAAAATGVGAAGALGAFGGAAAGAGGAGGAGAGAATGAGAVGATGVGAGAIGAGAAGGGAASTGGLLAALGGAGSAGKWIQTGADVAGGLSQGMADKRAGETAFGVQQDLARQRASEAFERAQQDRAQVEINQRQEGRTALNDAYRQALMSAAVLGVKDASFTRPSSATQVSFSGGFRPSALGEPGRLAASEMNRRAMEGLMKPKPTMELPPLEQFQPQATMKNAGFWENLLGAAGTAGLAYGDLSRPQNQPRVGQGQRPKLTDIGSPGEYERSLGAEDWGF